MPRRQLLASIYFSPVSLNRRAVRAKAVSPVAPTYFHRFRSRLDGPVPRQVLQPVGPAGYLDQVAVVAHPVRDRARRHVVPEHPAPAADPHVGGDDRRALLVARRYQPEQQVRARAADVEVAELVDLGARDRRLEVPVEVRQPLDVGNPDDRMRWLVILTSRAATSTRVISSRAEAGADSAMRGRVFGLASTIYAGCLPVGMLLIGPASDLVPLRAIMSATASSPMRQPSTRPRISTNRRYVPS